MQDARLRLLATITLSFAAVASITGAVITFLWWSIFTPGWRAAPRRGLLVALLFIGAVSVVLQLAGGAGTSYFIRFSAVLLVAVWTYAAFRPGELLDLAVWLFGDVWGFDLGLIGEMSLQSLQVSAEDISRIITAQRLKGLGWGWRSLAPGLATLVHVTLHRAGEQAVLLAIRGYQKGGSHKPLFPRGKRDVLATAIAMLALAAAILARDLVVL